MAGAKRAIAMFTLTAFAIVATSMFGAVWYAINEEEGAS